MAPLRDVVNQRQEAARPVGGQPVHDAGLDPADGPIGVEDALAHGDHRATPAEQFRPRLDDHRVVVGVDELQDQPTRQLGRSSTEDLRDVTLRGEHHPERVEFLENPRRPEHRGALRHLGAVRLGPAGRRRLTRAEVVEADEHHAELVLVEQVQEGDPLLAPAGVVVVAAQDHPGQFRRALDGTTPRPGQYGTVRRVELRRRIHPESVEGGPLAHTGRHLGGCGAGGPRHQPAAGELRPQLVGRPTTPAATGIHGPRIPVPTPGCARPGDATLSPLPTRRSGGPASGGVDPTGRCPHTLR